MTRRGFTLSEILVSIGIFAIVGTIAAMIYVNIGTFTQSEQLRIDVDVSSNRILGLLNEQLRQGKEVLSSYSSYTTGPSTLVFTMPSIVSSAPSPTVVDTGVLYLDNGSLKLLIDADPTSSRTDETREITHNVQDVYFRYTNVTPTAATGVTVTVTTTKAVSGKTYTQASILNATLSNHP